MKPKEFIEKAIEGGWKYDNQLHELTENGDFIIQTVLLDTKAWEAVGKVEGWGVIQYTDEMRTMIDHLVEGGNVEGYLKNL